MGHLAQHFLKQAPLLFVCLFLLLFDWLMHRYSLASCGKHENLQAVFMFTMVGGWGGGGTMEDAA